MSYANDLRENFSLLDETYPGYEDVLAQALLALLTKEHMLWYSKPGRAKSLIARAVFRMFAGARTFPIQLKAEMLSDALFGNIIAKELMEKGREIYNLEGGAAAVEFLFLDEFFDASDILLRDLLNLLNERVFMSKDMGEVRAPLHSAICTTNYLRQREATEAVLDRLLFQAVIRGIDGYVDSMRAGRVYLGFPGKHQQLNPLDYQGLLELATLVEQPEASGGIAITPGMRLLHCMLVTEFQQRRIQAATDRWHAANPDAVDPPTAEDLGVREISTRTLVKLHDVLRASAVLDNRHLVLQSDHRFVGFGLRVVGDDSGDDVVWDTLCAEFLGLSGRRLNSLETLGQIADTLGKMKAEGATPGPAQVMIGGTMYERTAIGLQGVTSRVRGDHPVLKLARQQLSAEAAGLTHAQSNAAALLRG